MLALLVLLAVPAYAAGDEPVKIAVIDTGISTAAIDPAHIAQGYNYIRTSDDTADKIGHGTAIASILVGSEKAGVEGICPKAVLVPLVYYSVDENGKTVKGDAAAMVAQAVYDAVDVFGCRIINISSSTTTDTESLREAAAYAESRGALVVSCAGNSNLDHPALLDYPAAYDTVLCVGSANPDGSVSSFSQRNDTVDLLAPGTSLRAATTRGTTIRADGTSFAAAYVSGAAATLLSEYPDLNPTEIRRILCGAATEICSGGYDTDSGWRVLDLNAALQWATQGRRFRDVLAGQWFCDAVRKSTDAGLFGGDSQTLFLPDTSMTRAMLWMALFRLDSNATRTNQATRYTNVQAWAMMFGLTDGSDRDGVVTREQTAAILYRYAARKGYDVSARADLSRFTDAGTVSGYAVDAMAWATAEGLVSGTSNSALTAKSGTTRAQAAAILVRFYENFMKHEQTSDQPAHGQQEAYLMKENGYDCIGATMRLFDNKDAGVSTDKACCSLDDTAEQRGVPPRQAVLRF